MSTIILAPIVEKFITEVTKKYVKDFVVKDKSKPTGIMKVISKIVSVFNPDFNKVYVTTIAETAWAPIEFSKQRPNTQLELIVHETVHEHDMKKLGKILYAIVYLSPQILSILSVLSILSIFFGAGWLWFLLFLVFAAPLPSPGRMWLEIRGYRSGIMFCKNVYKNDSAKLEEKINWFTTQFTGQYYYFMWPWKSYVRNKLLDTSFEKEEIYVEILNWLKTNKVIEQEKN